MLVICIKKKTKTRIKIEYATNATKQNHKIFSLEEVKKKNRKKQTVKKK